MNIYTSNSMRNVDKQLEQQPQQQQQTNNSNNNNGKSLNVSL